jgi:hypothetical protein
MKSILLIILFISSSVIKSQDFTFKEIVNAPLKIKNNQLAKELTAKGFGFSGRTNTNGIKEDVFTYSSTKSSLTRVTIIGEKKVHFQFFKPNKKKFDDFAMQIKSKGTHVKFEYQKELQNYGDSYTYANTMSIILGFIKDSHFSGFDTYNIIISY